MFLWYLRHIRVTEIIFFFWFVCMKVYFQKTDIYNFLYIEDIKLRWPRPPAIILHTMAHLSSNPIISFISDIALFVFYQVKWSIFTNGFCYMFSAYTASTELLEYKFKFHFTFLFFDTEIDAEDGYSPFPLLIQYYSLFHYYCSTTFCNMYLIISRANKSIWWLLLLPINFVLIGYDYYIIKPVKRLFY